MCSAASSNRIFFAASRKRSSMTIESIPPLTHATTRSPRRTCVPSTAQTRSNRGLSGSDFLVLAIAHQPFEPRVKKFVDRLVLHLPPGVLQGLLERLHHCIIVAVCSTGGLIDDLVDETKGFKPGRRDAER